VPSGEFAGASRCPGTDRRRGRKVQPPARRRGKPTAESYCALGSTKPCGPRIDTPLRRPFDRRGPDRPSHTAMHRELMTVSPMQDGPPGACGLPCALPCVQRAGGYADRSGTGLAQQGLCCVPREERSPGQIPTRRRGCCGQRGTSGIVRLPVLPRGPDEARKPTLRVVTECTRARRRWRMVLLARWVSVADPQG
jgi:hypothetical protein